LSKDSYSIHLADLAGEFTTPIRRKTMNGQLKGWRTIAVSVAIAAVGALQTAGLADIIPAPYVGPALMALGFAMAWLRGITDTPAGVK
jgi:anti-sigma-K factor RskA